MSLAICPTCGARYQKDEPWKKTCLKCWQKKRKVEKGPSGADDELRHLRAEVFALRQMLGQPRRKEIDPDMLSRLIRLCHPDKHGNSEASNKATIWLLEQRT